MKNFTQKCSLTNTLKNKKLTKTIKKNIHLQKPSKIQVIMHKKIIFLLGIFTKMEKFRNNTYENMEKVVTLLYRGY